MTVTHVNNGGVEILFALILLQLVVRGALAEGPIGGQAKGNTSFPLKIGEYLIENWIWLKLWGCLRGVGPLPRRVRICVRLLPCASFARHHQ